ncbi:MAG TPA: hypothetical protein VGI39_04190 [Polyangiaceae bacterium]|jgi:hypothetical protein
MGCIVPIPLPKRAVPSVSTAQFRLMQRLKAGLRAPVSRYHSGSIRALERKGVVVPLRLFERREIGACWRFTPLADEVFATKGRGRP